MWRSARFSSGDVRNGYWTRPLDDHAEQISNRRMIQSFLPPAVFWWPAAAGGAAGDIYNGTQNTIVAGMFSIMHPDSTEYIPMGNWGAHDVLGRAAQTGLSIFALGAEDGLSAIQSFQLLQELARMAQADASIKQALAGRRTALIFSSARTAQPNLTLENQMMPLLKKCGFIYLGAYWHYAGSHPGWLLQNGPKAASFRARIDSELLAIAPPAAALHARETVAL
jgi:hypothetical protein